SARGSIARALLSADPRIDARRGRQDDVVGDHEPREREEPVVDVETAIDDRERDEADGDQAHENVETPADLLERHERKHARDADGEGGREEIEGRELTHGAFGRRSRSRESSSGRISSSIASSTAPSDPGKTTRSFPRAKPAIALMSIAPDPMCRWLSMRNSSAKPGISRSRRSRATSTLVRESKGARRGELVPSADATPVPPVTRMPSTSSEA